MKKRILSIALALCLVFSLLPVTALAATSVSGVSGNISWSIDSKGTLTVSVSGKMYDYYRVQNADGDYVTSAPWGEYYKSIKSIVLKDGVTSIGEYAFYKCSSLTSVTIPDSVTSIGEFAFCGCSNLTRLTIGSGVTSIGQYAFSDGSNIKDVYYSGTIANWSKITGTSSGNSFNKATFHCTDGNFIKYGNTGGSSLSGESLFWTLDDRGTLTISGTGKMGYYDSCKTIDGDVDSTAPWKDYKGSIKSVVIDDGVTNISGWAFAYCSSLTSVTIPDSVTSIGNNAFYKCSSLTEIIVDKTNEAYCSVNGVLFNKNKTELLSYPAGQEAVEYTIPSSVTSISESAFFGCGSLTSVMIPDSVASIGDCAFAYCGSLTEIIVDKNNEAYCSVNGVLFNKSKTELLSYPAGKEAEEYAIPNGVTSISDSAFSGCRSLRSVMIPGGVTSIGDNAFRSCSRLTSVTIPDSVTSIGECAFYGCSSLTGVTIPDSVTSIGGYAFYDCSSLASVTIPNSVTRIGGCAFAYCSRLTSVTIPDSVTRVAAYTFVYCSSLASVTIPGSVTSIGDSAFYGCSSLTSVTIPGSVTSIGRQAFSGCRSLKDVAFGGTKRAFSNTGYSFSSGVRVHYNCASLAGHFVQTEVKEPSCESAGYIKYGCTCGYEYIDEITDSHNYVYSKTVAPTCIEHGYDLLICSKCGDEKKEYKDDELLKHSYQITVVEPSCLTGGYTLHKCSVCGDSYKDELEPPLGHSFGEWVQTKAPTCTENGSESRTCANCGKAETGTVAALDHKLVHHKGKAATCTEKGWKAYDTCKRCDYTTYEEIAALEHNLVHHKGKAPTCTKVGWEAYDTCTRCDYTTYEEIAALGHDFENGVCTACGATNYIAAPTLKITTSAGKPKISWNKIDGATRYNIYRSTDGESYKYLTYTTKTSYTNSKATIGTKYFYQVTAVNAGGTESEFSNAKSIKCVPATPTLTISRVNGKPKLSWKAVTGATKYYIYRSTDGKTYKYYASTTKTSYTNTNVKVGTKYYYKVKAVAVVNKVNVGSAYSTAKSLLVSTAAPVVKITTSNGNPKISWSKVTGATKYYICRSTDGKTYKYYTYTTKTAYTDTKAKAGTKYYYKVKAVAVVNKTNIASVYSNAVSIKAK